MSIAFVKGANKANLSGTTPTLSFTATNAGDMLFMSVSWGTSVTCAVSDNHNGTWNALPAEDLTGAGGKFVQGFYIFNTSGSALTITFTFSGGGASFGDASICEFSGGLNTLDQHTETRGAGTSLSVGPTSSTTSANELVVVYACDLQGSNAWTLGSGYTNLEQGGNTYSAQESQVVSSTGTQSGTFTNTQGSNYSIGIATFANVTPPVPTSIAATTGAQGTTGNVTVTGTNFDAGGTSTLSFSGTGITVNSYGTRNGTTLVANITIAANATLSARDVIVTNASTATGTLAAAFTIISGVTTGSFVAQPTPCVMTDAKGNVFTTASLGGTAGAFVGNPTPICMTNDAGNAYTQTFTTSGGTTGSPVAVIPCDPSGHAYVATGTLTGIFLGHPTAVIPTNAAGAILSPNDTVTAQEGSPTPIILTDATGHVLTFSGTHPLLALL